MPLVRPWRLWHAFCASSFAFSIFLVECANLLDDIVVAFVSLHVSTLIIVIALLMFGGTADL